MRCWVLPKRSAAARWLSPSSITARRTSPYNSTPYILLPPDLLIRRLAVAGFYAALPDQSRASTWPIIAPPFSNPLGLAAVRLEPGLLIYLHDTNRRDLFAEEQRALSHGCVRVERWDALSAWILDISLSEVHRLANGPTTIDMPAAPIPVTFGYFTRFPDASGRVVEHEDVYKRQGGRTSRAQTEEQSAMAPALACAPLASAAIE